MEIQDAESEHQIATICSDGRLVTSTAIYMCDTWKSTVKVHKTLDVFHRRNLRKIMELHGQTR